jgi:hypothetical protein
MRHECRFHAGAGASDQLRGAVALPLKQAGAYGASTRSLLVSSGRAARHGEGGPLSAQGARLVPQALCLRIAGRAKAVHFSCSPTGLSIVRRAIESPVA